MVGGSREMEPVIESEEQRKTGWGGGRKLAGDAFIHSQAVKEKENRKWGENTKPHIPTRCCASSS